MTDQMEGSWVLSSSSGDAMVELASEWRYSWYQSGYASHPLFKKEISFWKKKILILNKEL